MTNASVPGVMRSTFDTVVTGQPKCIDCLRVDGQSPVVQPGWLSVVRPQDDWADGIEDLQRVIEALRSSGVDAVLLAFPQRAGIREPQHALFLWGDDSLTEFERRCGFEPLALPRLLGAVDRQGPCGRENGVASRMARRALCRGPQAAQAVAARLVRAAKRRRSGHFTELELRSPCPVSQA